MGASELPPCCRGCELYEAEARHCLLLAHPTEENRRHLLTMPCNVQELLTRRFRRVAYRIDECPTMLRVSATDGGSDFARVDWDHVAAASPARRVRPVRR